MTETSAAAPPPATSPPPPEAESEAQYVLSIIALISGFLFLLAGGMLLSSAAASPLQQNAAHTKIVLAIGAFLFVLGAMLRLGAWGEALRKRSSHQALNSLLMSALAILVVAVLNWLSVEHNFWRADLTAEGLYTLSERSRALVHGLERDVHLVVLLRGDDREVKDILDPLLGQYETASSHVKHEYIDPDRLSQREVEAKLKELELNMEVLDEDQVLGVLVQSGVQTAEGWKKDKSKHIPRGDLWQEDVAEGRKKTFVGEQKLSSAILEVLSASRPKLYFLAGHDECGPDSHEARTGLSSLAGILRQNNNEVLELKLGPGKEVPDDCALLVVAGPKRTIESSEVTTIQRYLDRGGDAILCLDPSADRRAEQTRMMPTGLEELCRDPYGVVVEDRYLLCQGYDQLGRPAITDQIPGNEFDLGHKVSSPLSRNQGMVFFQGARPLKVVGTGSGAPTALVRIGPEFLDHCRSTTDWRVDFSRGIPGEQKGPFTLVVASEREIATPPGADGQAAPKRRSRVVVVGDVTWLTNAYLVDTHYLNLELFQNAAAWCMEREQEIVGKASRPKSYRLTMDTGTLVFFKFVSVFGLPLIALSLGTFVWLIRRR